MDLTQRLWRFWEGLNQVKIDWAFIFDESVSSEEREQAKKMLIDRGFVNPIDTHQLPEYGSSTWKVVTSDGNNINPCFEGKRWYFRAQKYAKTYADYLVDRDGIKSKCSVEFGR